ncbi:hypothetical protein MMC10_000217 [Thelotrema lepadinum]|nr:hypothetical protein [Thelotrema lepadinum]
MDPSLRVSDHPMIALEAIQDERHSETESQDMNSSDLGHDKYANSMLTTSTKLEDVMSDDLPSTQIARPMLDQFDWGDDGRSTERYTNPEQTKAIIQLACYNRHLCMNTSKKDDRSCMIPGLEHFSWRQIHNRLRQRGLWDPKFAPKEQEAVRRLYNDYRDLIPDNAPTNPLRCSFAGLDKKSWLAVHARAIVLGCSDTTTRFFEDSSWTTTEIQILQSALKVPTGEKVGVMDQRGYAPCSIPGLHLKSWEGARAKAKDILAQPTITQWSSQEDEALERFVLSGQSISFSAEDRSRLCLLPGLTNKTWESLATRASFLNLEQLRDQQHTSVVLNTAQEEAAQISVEQEHSDSNCLPHAGGPQSAAGGRTSVPSRTTEKHYLPHADNSAVSKPIKSTTQRNWSKEEHEAFDTYVSDIRQGKATPPLQGQGYCTFPGLTKRVWKGVYLKYFRLCSKDETLRSKRRAPGHISGSSNARAYWRPDELEAFGKMQRAIQSGQFKEHKGKQANLEACTFPGLSNRSWSAVMGRLKNNPMPAI